ncbi:MAG: UDP-N-acetylmuramate dehydrogenase [Elusimicrobiales bacterium]|nr:UDP-N-acetylmuramate dehydrogenase [Elusimicrobiales bacterium]
MDKYIEIKKRFLNKFIENKFAKEFTSYKVGGKIDIIVYPENIEDLLWLFEFIKKTGIKYFICGNSTNILVSDNGFRGVFIKTERIKNIEVDGLIIRAQSGFLWDDMIRIAVNNGLDGLVKTSYIPGSVGGAVRMNAGAFGEETFDCLESVDVIDLNNLELKTFKKKDIVYGYRYVRDIENFFILSGEFRFRKSDKEELLNLRNEIIKKRIEKQPLDYPSAGSVFKRPLNNYASKLIDECGLKGLSVGGAMVSKKHCGFIINYNNATASDIYSLIKKVREIVYNKTGIELELEQVLVGEF